MSTKDVIKSRVYESIAGGTGISFMGIFFILIIACVVGIYIFLIYKYNSKAAFYSKDLNVTMAGMVVVIAAIMIAMQSNLIVSLGMVGALSIVRFRNAVKNPLDLLYVFWAVCAGIIVGVRLEVLAVVLCVVMTILLFVLEVIPDSKAPALLIIHMEEREEAGTRWDEINTLLRKYAQYHKVKSKNVRKEETEVIIEIRCSKSDELLAEIKKIESIGQINYLEYDGEYRG